MHPIFQEALKGFAPAPLTKLEIALAQREALQRALDQIEYASRKDSLTDAERLDSIRVILGRVGGEKL